MKPGDLVRINLPWIVSPKHPNPHHDQVGIILGESKRGPYKVFVVLLQSGRTETFQKSSLQVVS